MQTRDERADRMDIRDPMDQTANERAAANDRDVASERDFAEQRDLAEDRDLAQDRDMAENRDMAEDRDMTQDPDLAQDRDMAEDRDMTQDPDLAQDRDMAENRDMAEDRDMTQDPDLAQDRDLAQDPDMVQDRDLAQDPQADMAGGSQPAEESVGDHAELPSTPLWDSTAAEGLRARWHEVQMIFVDDPRAAVEQAETLFDEASQRLSEALAACRSEVSSWHSVGRSDTAARSDTANPNGVTGQHDTGNGNGGGDTERMRQAVQRYREVFDRLLAV